VTGFIPSGYGLYLEKATLAVRQPAIGAGARCIGFRCWLCSRSKLQITQRAISKKIGFGPPIAESGCGTNRAGFDLGDIYFCRADFAHRFLPVRTSPFARVSENLVLAVTTS
jgi:hypothetical protein